ncbi:MAG: hypothetical protein M3362_02715 [Acidobacteriota bacterium]|nr:hypothetical protein [Acidobacteriota bacterium]
MHAHAFGKINPETNPDFLDFLPRLGSKKSVVGDEAKWDLSDAAPFLVARLGFSFFGVVEHYQWDLLLTDSSVADSPSSDSHLPDYLAADSTAIGISRRFLVIQAVQAALRARFFSNCPSPAEPSSQQAAAVKVFFSVSRQKQHFSLTPSESVSVIPCWWIEINDLHEEKIVNAPDDVTSAGEVQ